MLFNIVNYCEQCRHLPTILQTLFNYPVFNRLFNKQLRISAYSFKDIHTPIGVVSPSHELLQRSTTKDEAKDKQITADVKGKLHDSLALLLILQTSKIFSKHVIHLS